MRTGRVPPEQRVPAPSVPPTGLRLAVALSWVWDRRGHLAEGLQWLEGALARAAAGAGGAAGRLAGRGDQRHRRQRVRQPVPGRRLAGLAAGRGRGKGPAATLVYNPASRTSELFFVGRDRQARQARRTAAGWGQRAGEERSDGRVPTKWVAAPGSAGGEPIGAVTEHPVAAVPGVDGGVDLLIAGRDGADWQHRFQAGADERKVSFAADIQPLFDAHCRCQVGGETAAGLDQEDGSAYDDMAGAPSFPVDLNPIEPGARTRATSTTK